MSFVNRVSHELRTPLTNIVLNADLAADALDNRPQEAGRRLDVVREEAARLTRLVDNVLDFSRRDSIHSTKPDSMVNPRDLVDSVVRPFEPAFRRRGMSLRLTGEAPPCQLESDLLTQILANLLSNAEKYAPCGEIAISLERVGTDLVMQVRDQGPGVPEADAQRIFEPFVRLHDQLTEGVAGAGLGLSIARDAAARLGGTLGVLPRDTSVSSTTGAVFELRLPLYAAKPATRVAAETNASESSLPQAGNPSPSPP
ncbi:MAG: sensor histidine kinase [Verrucomicrobiales bacterium]